jgi:hypothetical protein
MFKGFNNAVVSGVGIRSINASGLIEVENIFMYSCRYFLKGNTNSNNVINTYNSRPYSDLSMVIFLIKQVAAPVSIYDYCTGVPSLDFSVLTFTGMQTIDADIQPIYDRKQTPARGLETRNEYNMVFYEDHEMPDSMKKMSDNYVFVVHRTDIEEILIPATVAKKILNFALFETDGTTAFDFDYDENFLIKCTDGTVFLWYQNKLNATVYGDTWDGTTYTIERCFQIWDIQNVAVTERWDLTSSPLQGSIRFNNVDNEVILR